jgi:hypothetical protein
MGPNPLYALVRTIFNAVTKRFLSIQRDSGIQYRSASNNSMRFNSTIGSSGADEILDFTVGYDGTNNIMAFRWDLSEFDSNDLWLINS